MAYNLGGALGDIYSPNSQPLEFDFYVQEIISNPENLVHTYKDKETGERKFWKYDRRYAHVLNDAFKNRSKIKPLKYILNYISKHIGFADSIASYNWNFDKQALKKTVLEYWQEDYKEIDSIPATCIMDCFANRVINRNYFSMVDEVYKIEMPKSIRPRWQLTINILKTDPRIRPTSIKIHQYSRRIYKNQPKSSSKGFKIN